MHILGIGNGSLGGNSEIALKAALKGAQEVDPSITASWIHMPSVSIPLNPKPLEGMQDVSLGSNKSMMAGSEDTGAIADDRSAVLDAILDADAYIFATPIYSHSPAGFMKSVMDRVCGPYTDAVFADTILQAQKAGDSRYSNVQVDVRVTKSRVAAFIAIGGSSTPDQITMALPILHTLTYPMHAKVVDQVVFLGCGTPGSVIARAQGQYIQRATDLGKSVASQLGKSFDEAEFLGEESDDACPYCHLAKVDLFGGKDNKIGCVTCGAEGHLSMDSNGIIRPVWNNPCGLSSITWAGKKLHIRDIQKGAAAEMSDIEGCADYDLKKQQWANYTIPSVKMPSMGQR